jgi:hypothetical protein
MRAPKHPLCETLRDKGMAKVRHKQTGETALAMACGFMNTAIRVQFDRFDHPQSHGWHNYDPDYFELVGEENA